MSPPPLPWAPNPREITTPPALDIAKAGNQFAWCFRRYSCMQISSDFYQGVLCKVECCKALVRCIVYESAFIIGLAAMRNE